MVQSIDIQSSILYGVIAGIIVFGVITLFLYVIESPEFKKHQLRLKAKEEVYKQQEKAAFEQARQQEKQRIAEHDRRVEEAYQKLLKKEGL